MNESFQNKDEILIRISRLLEFYSSRSLHCFYHGCEENKLDPTSMLLQLEGDLMTYLDLHGEAPSLQDLVTLSFQLSGTDPFHISEVEYRI